tara:strand:+ start:6165 stop:6389 length:225 start_codon:yes stop_codon:yes gene_type:complete
MMYYKYEVIVNEEIKTIVFETTTMLDMENLRYMRYAVNDPINEIVVDRKSGEVMVPNSLERITYSEYLELKQTT